MTRNEVSIETVELRVNKYEQMFGHNLWWWSGFLIDTGLPIWVLGASWPQLAYINTNNSFSQQHGATCYTALDLLLWSYVKSQRYETKPLSICVHHQNFTRTIAILALDFLNPNLKEKRKKRRVVFILPRRTLMVKKHALHCVHMNEENMKVGEFKHTSWRSAIDVNNLFEILQWGEDNCRFLLSASAWATFLSADKYVNAVNCVFIEARSIRCNYAAPRFTTSRDDADYPRRR